MIKWKKLGFISIELVIVAALIMGAGLISIGSLGVNGKETVQKGLNRLNSFWNSEETGGEEEPEVPPIGTEYGYDSTLNINTLDINPEEDFSFVWSDSLNGWVITEYVNNTDKSVVVPSKRADNKTIVSIGDNAFLNDNLTSIAIPNSIVSIGKNVFTGSQFASVVIPGSVKTIGERAFYQVTLHDIILREGVQALHKGAFEDIDSLTSITFPESIQSIGENAFANSEIKLFRLVGQTPPTLGTGAFLGVNTPGTILYPKEYQSNYQGAGWTNAAYTAYEIENGTLYTWDSVNNGWILAGFTNPISGTLNVSGNRTDSSLVVGVGPYALYGQQVSALTLPNTIKTIGRAAFSHTLFSSLTMPTNLVRIEEEAFKDSKIQSIVIPSSVNWLGQNSFFTTSLTSVTFLGNVPSVTALTTNTPFRTSNLNINNVLVPAAQLTAYQNASTELGISRNYFKVNPTDANSDGSFSYSWNSTLNGWNLVSYMDTSKTVVIPNTRPDGEPIVSIANDAFRNKGITSLILPDNLKTIGSNAFNGNSFPSVEIPAGVTSLGGSSFGSNTSLKSVIFKGALPTTNSNAFNGSTLPSDSVWVPVEHYVVYRNAATGMSLTSLSIMVNPYDSGVENGYAYSWNSTLNGWNVVDDVNTTDKNVVIPSTRLDGTPIVSIGDFAFAGNGITSLTLPGQLVSIGQNAFNGNQIINLVLPETLKTIGLQAFNSNKIASLIVPSSVTSIGSNAFSNNLMTSLVFNGVKPTLGSAIFQLAGTFTNGSILVPSDQFTAYKSAATALGVNASFIMVNPNDAAVEGDFAYSWNSTLNGWSVVDYINRSDKSLVIPSTRNDGLSVVEIQTEVFRNMNITSVTLSNNLKVIGTNAFFGNPFNSVVLPEGLTTIGSGAFQSTAITSIVIPNTVTNLGSNAFQATSLSSVKFNGTKPTTLGTGIFSGVGTLGTGSVLVPSAHLTSYQASASTFSLISSKFAGY